MSQLKHCGLCSISSCRSYGQKNRMPTKYKLRHTLPDAGMRCSRTGAVHCRDCLRLMIDKIKKSKVPTEQLQSWTMFNSLSNYLSEEPLRRIEPYPTNQDSCICCQFMGKLSDVSIPVFTLDSVEVEADLIIDESTEFESTPEVDEAVLNQKTPNLSNANISKVTTPTSSPSKPSTPKRACKTRGASGRTRTSVAGKTRRHKQNTFHQRITASHSEYDGIWFDEAHALCIKWPPGYLSSHILGAMTDSGEDGIIHGVITPDLARKLGQQVPFEKFNTLSKATRMIRKERIVDKIEKEDGTIFEFTNLVLTFDNAEYPYHEAPPAKSRNKTMSVQRRQLPTVDMLKQMTLLDLSSLEGCNVLTVVGEPHSSKSDSFCLFMGFDESFDHFDYRNESIYHSLKKRAGRNGIEAMRSGGSNGYMDMKDEDTRRYVRRLIRTRGSIPRKATSTLVVGINEKKRSGLLVFYISCASEELKCCSWLYSTPRPGGQQKLKQEQLKDHPELYRFPDVRVSTAKILCRYNEKLGDREVVFDKRPNRIRPVNRTAVYNMFVEATEAKIIASKDNSVPTFMQNVLPQLATSSVHTLLEYPTRAHVDVFRGREKDKIENKVIMTVGSMCDYGKNVALGRGGAGRGVYAYAIIDHSESAEVRRDIRNRRGYFLASFPELSHLRVTQQLMTEFFPGYNPQRPGDDPGPPGPHV